MALIDISGLTFGYEGSNDLVFENVSFQMDTDWRLGLIGRNGRGKTTLLHLLEGRYAHRGSIKMPVPCDYFPFEIENPAQEALAVAQQIACGCEQWQLERELSLLALSQEALARPFETLSNGERTKVMLAALFARENRFLLIDEPTNHLDLQARDLVAGYLSRKSGFILVSHDRTFLDRCVDHIVSINRVDIDVQKGNFSSWFENYQRQQQFELAQNKRLERDVRRLSEAASRTAQWSQQVEKTKFGHLDSGVKPDKGRIGHKAAKMMKRSKITQQRRENALAEKAALLKNAEQAESLSISPLHYHAQRLVLASSLAVCYNGKLSGKLVDFEVCRGDRIALVGANGSGKSSLLALLAGEPLSYTGTLQMGSGLVVSYAAQDTSGMKGNLRELARQNGIDESLLKTFLRKFGFSREQFEKDICEFSSGQKKKTALALSLCKPAHLYIWDEPLNYMDVISRMQMERLILESRPTLLFVEHDRSFVQAVATQEVLL